MMKIFFAIALLASPVRGNDPLANARFQSNPFAGVCDDVPLLANKDYNDNKACSSTTKSS